MDDVEHDGGADIELLTGMCDCVAAVVAERDRLWALRDSVQKVLDEADDANEWTHPLTLVREILNAEVRTLIDSGRLDAQVIRPGYAEGVRQLVAERDRDRARAEEAEHRLADLHQLINESIAKVLDAAGPEDEDNPAIQRLRQLDANGKATDG